MMRRLAPVLALAAVLASSAARAQEPDASVAEPVEAVPADGSADGPAAEDPRREEARQLFESALPLLEAQRFEEAQAPLRRSLELFPNLPTAFNLAVALRRSGDTNASIALFEEIAAGAHGELSEAQQGEVRAEIARARRDLATLRIRATGAERIRILIDGEHVGDVANRAELAWQVQAGEHVVGASAAGRSAVEERVTVRRGQRRRVELALEAGPGVASPAEAAAAGVRGGPLHPPEDPAVDEGESSVPLWIGLGLAAAAAITVGVVLVATRDREADPVTDPVLPVVETLRF